MLHQGDEVCRSEKIRVYPYTRPGGPFELVDPDIPQPGPGWVRIKVQASGLAAELQKLGGAKVILATVTAGDAMSAVLGGLGLNGTLVVIGAAQSMQVSPRGLIMGRCSVTGWSLYEAAPEGPMSSLRTTADGRGRTSAA